MKIRLFQIVLWVLGSGSAFFALKSSSEPIHPVLENTWFELLFDQFQTGNTIIFNLSIGFLVSIIFYLIVVWYPEHRKKSIIKHNMSETYKYFKREMVHLLMSACSNGGGGYEGEKLGDLTQMHEFRDYFKVYFREDQNRWHAVANGLDEYLLKKLLVELEILLHETTFILNNVYIDDEHVFSFFKRLSQSVFKMKNYSLDYDEIKSLLSFLWEIFAGWSYSDGYKDEEIVKIMIAKI